MKWLAVGIAAGVVVLAAGSLATLASRGPARPDNATATRTYLLARHQYEVATQYDQAAGEREVRALVERVKRQCPNALLGAPATSPVAEMKEEISNDIAITFAQPERHAASAFAMRAVRLHWTNPELTYYVHGSAKEELAKARLQPPDVCADATTLAKSGFRSVASDTARFQQQYQAANTITTVKVGPGESDTLGERILQLLRPYERRDERALIPHQPTRRERAQAEAVLVRSVLTPVSEMEQALGLARQPAIG